MAAAHAQQTLALPVPLMLYLTLARAELLPAVIPLVRPVEEKGRLCNRAIEPSRELARKAKKNS